MLIGHRDRGAVIFHFAHNLTLFTTQALLCAAQEVLHLINIIAVGQRHHGTLVPHLCEAFSDITAHALGRGERVLVLWVIPLQIL